MNAFIKKNWYFISVIIGIIAQYYITVNNITIPLLGVANTGVIALCLCSTISIMQLSYLHKKNLSEKEHIFWLTFIFARYTWGIYGILTLNILLIVFNILIPFLLIPLLRSKKENFLIHGFFLSAMSIAGVFVYTLQTPFLAGDLAPRTFEIIGTVISGFTFYSEVYRKLRYPDLRALASWRGSFTTLLSFIGWTVWAYQVGAHIAVANQTAICIAIIISYFLDLNHTRKIKALEREVIICP